MRLTISIRRRILTRCGRGDYALIERQLRQRRGHFMDPKLLRSQFADLEEPQPEEDVAVIKLGRSPLELVEEMKKKLRLR